MRLTSEGGGAADGSALPTSTAVVVRRRWVRSLARVEDATAVLFHCGEETSSALCMPAHTGVCRRARDHGTACVPACNTAHHTRRAVLRAVQLTAAHTRSRPPTHLLTATLSGGRRWSPSIALAALASTVASWAPSATQQPPSAPLPTREPRSSLHSNADIVRLRMDTADVHRTAQHMHHSTYHHRHPPASLREWCERALLLRCCSA